MTEAIFCQGCGGQIQSEDPNKTGFVPRSTLEKHELDNILCKRCFRLKHYNETQEVEITDNDFLQMVSSIRNKEGLIIHIIDVFDIEGSLISSLHRIVGNNPIVLVVNKTDLLPKSTNLVQLKQWIQATIKEHGLSVIDVFLISSIKGHGVEDLLSHIERLRDGKDVYVVGTTNAGKSTFINRIIKQATGLNEVITTSYFPGTTLGFIEIPLDDQSLLIDTPGIVNRKQMSHYLNEADLKAVTPKKEIKPRVYQLNSEQTLFIGGLARIDFVKGERQSFICYFANDLTIHRTKLSNADDLYDKHLGGLLSPPSEDSIQQLGKLQGRSFKIPGKKTDIIFPGLGWITFSEGNMTVDVHTSEHVSPMMRNSLH